MSSDIVYREELVVVDDGVQLETEVAIPSKIKSNTLVVLTHPYGCLGGDMHNPVIVKLWQGLAKRGIVSVRMNFRGVGHSGGRGTWRCKGEQHDVMAVINHFDKSPEFKTKPDIILLGYSFGSMISGSILSHFEKDKRLLGYIAIAYPFSVTWFLSLFNTSAMISGLQESSVPKLFVHGTDDNFTAISKARQQVERIQNGKLIALEGADHFFGRRRFLSVCIFLFVLNKSVVIT